MNWPQHQEYNEAIQFPKTCFADPDLKSGNVETTPLGLPRAIAGMFACVYRMSTPTGSWAVRCFVKGEEDTNRRYDEISKALKAARLSYTVDFEYQPNGIRVAGKIYPLIKMRWMQGELLDVYVGRNLTNRQRLIDLAKKWAAMARELAGAGIAHGDLQHGNVLVVNGEIKIIDYDGMFVPTLSGLLSHEIGHRNYQLPKRKGSDFGVYIDNFSHWIIYSSIRIVADNPGIYKTARDLGKDDCIIFSQDDYILSNHSPLLTALRNPPNSTATIALSEKISALIGLTPIDVPVLDETLFKDSPVIIVPQSGEWWRTHLPPVVEKPVLIEKKEFGSLPSVNREMVLFFALAMCLVLFVYFNGANKIFWYILPEIGMLSLVRQRLETHFRSSPEKRNKDEITAKLVVLDANLNAQKDRREKLKTDIGLFKKSITDLGISFQDTCNNIVSQQGREIKEANIRAGLERIAFEKRKRELDAEEHETFNQQIYQLDVKLRAFQVQVNAVDARRARTLDEALAKLRQDTLNTYLKEHSIDGAHIPQVGNRFKYSLLARGINTAADVTFGAVRKTPGFGQVRSSSMVRWRAGLENQYASKIPTKLPSAEMQKIDTHAAYEKSVLLTQIELVQNALNQSKLQVAKAYAPRRAQLASEERAIVLRVQAAVAAIEKQFSIKKEQLTAGYNSEQNVLNQQLVKSTTALPFAELDINTRSAELDGLRRQLFSYSNVSLRRMLWSQVKLGFPLRIETWKLELSELAADVASLTKHGLFSRAQIRRLRDLGTVVGFGGAILLTPPLLSKSAWVDRTLTIIQQSAQNSMQGQRRRMESTAFNARMNDQTKSVSSGFTDALLDEKSSVKTEVSKGFEKKIDTIERSLIEYPNLANVSTLSTDAKVASALAPSNSSESSVAPLDSQSTGRGLVESDSSDVDTVKTNTTVSDSLVSVLSRVKGLAGAQKVNEIKDHGQTEENEKQTTVPIRFNYNQASRAWILNYEIKTQCDSNQIKEAEKIALDTLKSMAGTNFPPFLAIQIKTRLNLEKLKAIVIINRRTLTATGTEAYLTTAKVSSGDHFKLDGKECVFVGRISP